MTFEEFITAHKDDDTGKLLLGRDKWPEVDMGLAVNTIESLNVLKCKVPEWYLPGILVFPSKLSAEQCSSSSTAKYKAALFLKMLAGKPDGGKTVVADLTGGLGIDSWAFASVASEVIYNEMDPILANAAKENFAKLGLGNIEVRNCKLKPGNVQEIIGDRPSPDMIFLDPARRSKDGRKVFFIEDCHPDILPLMDELLSVSKHILVKLSPMADISMTAEKLGGHTKEIHVISDGKECKELLIMIDRDWSGDYRVVACEGGVTLEFAKGEESGAVPIFPENGERYPFLFEPGKAILKAGPFNLLCGRLGLVKLGRSTQLYFAKDTGPLAGLGKVFRIVGIVELNNRNIKEMGKVFHKCEVTARNIPMTSDALRGRMGLASGDEAHIFGVRIDYPEKSGNYIVITKGTPEII